MKRISEKGFTLVEIVIAVFGSLLALLAVLSIFNQQHTNAVVQNQVGDMNQNSRLAINILESSIANAGFEFRNQVVGAGINPILAFMKFNLVTGSPEVFASAYLASDPTPLGTPLPDIQPDTDALVITTAFTMPNPANSNASEALCSFAEMTVDTSPTSPNSTAIYKACLPQLKCQLLETFLTTTATWFTDPGGLQEAENEPSLLVQWPDPDAADVISTQTLQLSNIALNSGCIEFTGKGEGFQVRPQHVVAPTFYSPPAGSKVSGALVKSHLYYLTADKRLVRVVTGHSNAGIPIGHVAFFQELAFDIDNLQIGFTDLQGGPILDVMPDSNPVDNLLDNDRIGTVHLRIVSRTRAQDPTNSGNIAISHYLPQLDDPTPPGALDGYRRRLMARSIVPGNLRNPLFPF